MLCAMLDEMSVISVEIERCSSKSAWYVHCVGRVFEVYARGRDYVLKKDYDRGHDTTWRHIDKSDCKIQRGSDERTQV